MVKHIHFKRFFFVLLMGSFGLASFGCLYIEQISSSQHIRKHEVKLRNTLELASSAHVSDGSDRAIKGRRRFVGPMGARAVTYKGYQYAIYYTGKDRSQPHHQATGEVIVARRPAGTKEWEKLVLNDYKIRSDDAHNRPAIAISKGDGVIHISFDHHNTPDIQYAHTAIGVANAPLDHPWEASLFKLNFNLGLKKDSDQQVTYPVFHHSPGGNLLMYYRNGGSWKGTMRLAYYDSSSHTWTGIVDISSFDGVYEGEERTRGPYLADGIKIAKNGDLHVAWVWREYVPECRARDGGAACNHGLFYASSTDGGKVWRNASGKTVADIDRDVKMSIDNIGDEVIDLPRELEPSNVAFSSSVDNLTGNFHVLSRHIVPGTDTMRMHHYVGTPSGEWRGGPSKFDASDVSLYFVGDTLFALLGRASAAIFYATRDQNFENWQEIIVPKPEGLRNALNGGYLTWDSSRIDQGFLTALWQEAPEAGELGKPTSLWVMDYQLMSPVTQ